MTAFHLDSFQGSLNLLIQLIQREEIELTELPLKRLIEQFQESQNSPLEEGAEFIGSTASLLLLKSKRLLPSLLQEDTTIEETPYETLFTHLNDYVKMRALSKELEIREEENALMHEKGGCFLDKTPSPFPQVTLEELKSLLEKMLNQKPLERKEIRKEVWQVSHKIDSIKERVNDSKTVDLKTLFEESRCKEEAIVTFLAILELLKNEGFLITEDLILKKVPIESEN
jgi:segregation and condensation protein A